MSGEARFDDVAWNEGSGNFLLNTALPQGWWYLATKAIFGLSDGDLMGSKVRNKLHKDPVDLLKAAEQNKKSQQVSRTKKAADE